MRRNLGDKGKEISDKNKKQILDTYINFQENKISKIYDNDHFMYTKVQIERPMIQDGEIVNLKSGKPKADPKKRDYEMIHSSLSVEEYFENEVKPHLPDSWMNRAKDKIGYEISFPKEFFEYKNLKPSQEILDEVLEMTESFNKLLSQINDE